MNLKKCEDIIQELESVLQTLNQYLDENKGWDNDELLDLNKQRLELTDQLCDVLPHPLPSSLETGVENLRNTASSLAEKIESYQSEAQDVLFKLQRQRKAQGAYQSVKNHG